MAESLALSSHSSSTCEPSDKHHQPQSRQAQDLDQADAAAGSRRAAAASSSASAATVAGGSVAPALPPMDALDCGGPLPASDVLQVSPCVSADDFTQAMWPALQPVHRLDSLIRSPSDRSEEDACTLASGGAAASSSCSPGGPAPEAGDGEPSTERVERLLGAAFDRLWRDRPIGMIGMPADGASPGEIGSIDGYISNYFRHVAELSRESVYQSHQRAILCRMREDVVAGDRSGSMRDLDERIQRVEINDRTLQAEIATRMRIVERSSGATPCCRARSPCCVPGPAACCAGEVEPSLAGRALPGCSPSDCSVQ